MGVSATLPYVSRDSSTPNWLKQLAQVLGRYRLPLREVSCADGVLRLVLGPEDTEPLLVTVRPRGDGPGWATTDSFVLGYRGPDQLRGTRRRWMSTILEVVRRLEHVLPRRLDEPGAVFHRQVSPAQRFSRRFPFCDVERATVAGQDRVEVLLRATSSCNQDCPFCSAPENRTPSGQEVSHCLEQAGRVYPGCMLSLTGGEPTLRPAFLAEVRQALDQPGIGHLQLQTNAVAFARRLDPADLPLTPRLSFFVSLHALDGELYDRCTASSGQLPRAKAGITRLIQAGHRVTINCLIQALNLDHLEAYVDALPVELPLTGDDVVLHFSVLICAERRPEAAEFLVRYSELAPRLEAAARRAEALGLTVDSLRSSTHASIPACLLDPRYRSRDPHRPHTRPGETGHEDLTLPWVKAARCKSCQEDRWCLGVPSAYARRFGLDELEPLTAGNKEHGTGNREQGTGNKEQGTREQGTGNKE